MQWNDFITWLRERGIMHLIPGLFANVDDFDVWVDDEDGHEPLPKEHRDNFFNHPLFCFAALDSQDHLQLLVVESTDFTHDLPTNGIDYRPWTEVVLERLAPHRLRMTLGRVYSGEAGELAAWLERKDLTLQQLVIV